MANGNNAGSALSKVTVLTVNKYIFKKFEFYKKKS